MAVDDGASGSLGSSFPENDVEIGPSVLSEEDLAWVDSCLSKDAEALGSGWDSLMDALMETAEVQHYPSDREDGNPSEGQRSAIPHSDEGIPTSNYLVNSYMSTSNRDQLTAELVDESWSEDKATAVFLPTYKGEAIDTGGNDPDTDLSNEPSPSDSLFDDIFKVWDLDIPQEEEPLVKQLTKVLDGSSSYPTAQNWKDFEASNDLSLDELVSGMADLSLSPDPGPNS